MTPGGWPNRETSAVEAELRARPALLAVLLENINSGMPHDSWDAQVAEAAGEVRALVLAGWHDLRSDPGMRTPDRVAMYEAIGDVNLVDWNLLGESFLRDVVFGDA